MIPPRILRRILLVSLVGATLVAIRECAVSGVDADGKRGYTMRQASHEGATMRYADRVRESTTSIGTGPLALAGAIIGFQSFGAVCAVGDTLYYAVEALAGAVPAGDWEVGIGTYSAADTLTRTQVLDSSAGGAPVNFAAGVKHVWIDLPAQAAGGFLSQADADAAYLTQAEADALYLTPAEGGAAYAPLAHTHPWASITAKPSTLAGYGITDAWTQAQADARYAPVAHSQAWGTITGTPVTLAGYGIGDAYTQAQADAKFLTPGAADLKYLTQATADARYAPLAHLQTWATITATPTTVAGYGIVDAYTKTQADARYAPLAHSQAWSTITGTPVTLGGYGITDAYTQAQADARYLGIAATAADAAKLLGATWSAPPVVGDVAPNVVNGTTITATVQLFMPAGTGAAPGIASSANPQTGFADIGGSTMDWCASGVGRIRFSGNGIKFRSVDSIQWAANSLIATAFDVNLQRDGAAGTLATVNGANPQTWRVYNKSTSTTYYERGVMTWNANVLEIGSEFGTGTSLARAVRLKAQGAASASLNTNGADRWQVNSAGNFVPVGNSGMVPRVKAGAFTDADFASPTDGLIGIDTTGPRIWARVAGVWKSALLS